MRQTLRHPYTMATGWALALIASSFFGRGSTVGTWFDAALYIGAGVWIAHTIVPRRAA